MRIALAVFTLALPGCITIPIPPGGEHMGKFGAIRISISYEGPNKQSERSSSMWYAATQFSRTLNDK
jgi:hypothetical protein